MFIVQKAAKVKGQASWVSANLSIQKGMDMGHCFLDGNADAVEFCPHSSFHNVLAASTYNLKEGDQPSRSGSISLFDVDAGSGRLELFHQVATAGIFDIKWSPVGALLAQADADGYVRVHRLQAGSDGSETKDYILSEAAAEKVSTSMCLFVDWNPSATSMAVGLSDGSVSVISVSESKLDIHQEWKGHEFEVWTASFDIHQPQLLYTGSDDCKFSCWDLREAPPTLAFQNSKTHTMGVCSIAKSPSDQHKLLTGSYDEHLRVWDLRSMSRPINETSVSLGGGVWRLKHHPSLSGIVLAACMHNGFAVVKVQDGAEVIETYTKHESLAYGADWQREESCQDGKRKRSVVATCSFYDKLLRVWTPESDLVQ